MLVSSCNIFDMLPRMLLFLIKSKTCFITLKLSYAISFQQIVDVNVNYNAREGRSTAEVRLFIHLFYTLEVSLFYH